MKLLRHTAALALVGWYLMLPPLDSQKNARTDEPLSQWEQWQAFDSAADCEGSKDGYLKKYQDNSKKDPKMANFYIDLMAKVAQGFCVASDDPRLAK